MKILLVEDDEKISSFIKKGLSEDGYVVDCTLDGEEAIYLASNNTYDLILLDIMIPIIDGLEVCKTLRKKGIDVPIIMLSAKNSLDDKITGLNEGANDYITKPFSFEELEARIKVQLRKGQYINNILKLNSLSLNLDKKEVRREDDILNLTSKEYAILHFMLLNQDKLITEEMINEAMWDMDSATTSNIISVYIYRLRNKIDKKYDTKLLHTIRGMGYRLSEKL